MNKTVSQQWSTNPFLKQQQWVSYTEEKATDSSCLSYPNSQTVPTGKHKYADFTSYYFWLLEFSNSYIMLLFGTASECKHLQLQPIFYKKTMHFSELYFPRLEDWTWHWGGYFSVIRLHTGLSFSPQCMLLSAGKDLDMQTAMCITYSRRSTSKHCT